MDTIISVFQSFGWWDGHNGKAYSKIMKLLKFSLFASFPILSGLGAVTSGDKEESIYLAVVAITSSIQVVRLFYIIWRQSESLALIDQISFVMVEDQEDFTRANNNLKRFMKFALCLELIIIVTVTLAFSIFANEKTLPVNIAFPLDWKKCEVGYWMAFAYITIVVIYSIVIFLFSIVIWYLMLSLSIKYYLLGNQLKRICMTKPGISNEEKDNFFLQDLILAVKSRQNLKETTARFKACFSTLILMQIITSSMGICGSVYSLAFGFHKSISYILIYAVILLHNIFDIFMLMFYGNEIKFAYARLSYCLFESNWIQRSNLCKKCMIIFVEVLNRQHELVVGKIYRLNLETFTSILNLAYTLFNILQSFN